MRGLTVLMLLLTALLAGCSDPPKADGGAAGATAGECDPADADCLAPAFSANSSVPAPVWAVGQWWEWEPSDASGTGDSFRSIVTSAGGGYTLATDEPLRAKQEAVFDHLLLGDVTAGLGTTSFGDTWDLLSFPLTDGKTWTATLPNIAWDVFLPDETVEVAMRATFDADLQGFTFMGHAGDGMLLEGTYLPATGWFGELTVYDIDPDQDPLEFSFVAKSAGNDYTGPVYTAESEQLLVLQDGNGFDAPPPEGQPVVQPQPHGTFTMGADTTLFGYLVAISVVGTRVVTLTDPAGSQRQVMSSATSLDSDDEQLLEIDEAGIAGAWQVATSGAGGFTMAYVELYEVTLSESQL